MDTQNQASRGNALMWRTLRRHRGSMTVAVVLCGLHQLFEALVPVAIGAIVANASRRVIGLRWLPGLSPLRCCSRP